MTLEFPNLTYDGIMVILENPCPECELDKMTTGELFVLIERINKIAAENPHNKKLFGKLMRLKSFVMLNVGDVE